MAKIVVEFKCLHCNEEDMENFDIKFMDEHGFPDENWNMTSGTQCNACFERVSWRRLPSDEAKLVEKPIPASGIVVCSNHVDCAHAICTHKIPHNAHDTCEESYCDVHKLYVKCNNVQDEVKRIEING